MTLAGWIQNVFLVAVLTGLTGLDRRRAPPCLPRWRRRLVRVGGGSRFACCRDA
jgi:hypothetical protein